MADLDLISLEDMASEIASKAKVLGDAPPGECHLGEFALGLLMDAYNRGKAEQAARQPPEDVEARLGVGGMAPAMFHVFCYWDNFFVGSMGDYRGSYNTFEEARKVAEGRPEKYASVAFPNAKGKLERVAQLAAGRWIDMGFGLVAKSEEK